jgi:hypothetical protein
MMVALSILFVIILLPLAAGTFAAEFKAEREY